MPSALNTLGRALRRAVFLSDLHLGAGDPAGIERARRFLDEQRARGTDGVFLLGDAFKAWLGPRSLRDAALVPFLEALSRLVREQVRVVLLHGNHDFLLDGTLARTLGVEVAGDALELDLGGARARLLHGDAFCTRDESYHRLHRVLRSRPVRWLVGQAPDGAVQGLADALNATSVRTTAGKAPDRMAIVDEEVEAVFAAGIDVVVCGHVHTARDELFPGGGRLVVLADFERSGCHAVWAGGRLSLVRHAAPFAADPALVIAIDGPAGSGKSAVARGVARQMDLPLLDSGALYRALTAKALRCGVAIPGGELEALARGTELDVDADGTVTMDGERMDEGVLRSAAVAARVSQLSADAGLRQALLVLQRDLASGRRGLVAEGRDMGSAVFPAAPFRFYLDARPEVRASRRLAQSPGEGARLDEVAQALEERDRRDTGRSASPLRLAPGAIRLDTSEMHLEAVIQEVLDQVARGLPRSA